MNKQKKPYKKPGIVIQNFETGEIIGTPEMVKKVQAAKSADSKETVKEPPLYR